MLIRVDMKLAGEKALGILVPPGAKTFVIVRPRGLPWDLLPARWTGDPTQPPQFCTFTRDDAARTARELVHALETASANGTSLVQTFGNANAVQIWVRTEALVWIACRRTPGEPYRPMVFPSPEEARPQAEEIAAIVCPAADARQEYYVNTQSFR